jgi:phytanoyl-CoA hydroxylase
MTKFILSDRQIKDYNTDGYLIVPALFSKTEISKLYSVALEDEVIGKNTYNMTDKEGKNSKLALWFTPGNDIYGLLSRSERIVNAVNTLLDGTAPVCHFHSKLMQKEPRVGGAWEWHQDYGYWYKNEFLFPDQMLSVMVAVTDATIENGCLQVIKGSHKMGRIEHGFSGDQVGASQKYVDLALKRMELVYVELKEGDTLFFHSNLLHRSDANNSETSRWSLISCYNRQTNSASNLESPSCIAPLETVGDEALLSSVASGMASDGDFLSRETDKSLKEDTK